MFDKDELPKRVLERTLPNLAAKEARNDPKMASPNDPKSIKNRCRNTVNILIETKSVSDDPFVPAQRNALASWGDYRGG